ncbi:MAG: single-stranded DNA-binding protein [Deltaproteobacteria bacterium]|nr:single-stranded DNA-binding protein [Deltaproteobacteria bacterium]
MSHLIPIYDQLSERLDRLTFGPPVAVVYNPLDYARAPATAYLERFGRERGRVLFLGMNPGPFGMVQTGVPFGEVAAARDWLRLEAPVERPPREHPKRPIEGFACRRAEVSGQRLWGLFKDLFGTPDRFFARAFVANYCPLAFVEESGANRTPDKLPAAEREPLFTACDEALVEIVRALQPSHLIGVGDFAKKRAEVVMKRAAITVPVASILHPSPASPRANRGWADEARRALQALELGWPEL